MENMDKDKIKQVAEAISMLKLNLFGVTTQELKEYARRMREDALRYDSAAALNRRYSVERSKFLQKAAETTEHLYRLRKSMDESEAASKECQDAEATHDTISKMFNY